VRKYYNKDMRCFALVSESKVLLNTGKYKDISKIVKGDKVMNMYGRSVVVRNVIKRQNTRHKALVTLKHDNWFNFLKCTEDQQILIWNDKERRADWVLADYLRPESNLYTLLPYDMKWDLPENFELNVNENVILKSSFALGFLFGVYLRVGNHYHTMSKVRFHCETVDKTFINEIIKICKNIFVAHPIENGDNEHLQNLDYMDDIMYNVFYDFELGNMKQLPDKYYCTNNEYVNGINCGIIYSGMNGFPSLKSNEKIFEVLYWSALHVKKPVNFGQLIRKHRNIEFLTGRCNLYSYDRMLQDVWALDVECDTGTYIVNNLIVRPD
jgi:hypothetical protein